MGNPDHAASSLFSAFTRWMCEARWELSLVRQGELEHCNATAGTNAERRTSQRKRNPRVLEPQGREGGGVSDNVSFGSAMPLSNEFGINKTVEARLLP